MVTRFSKYLKTPLFVSPYAIAMAYLYAIKKKKYIRSTQGIGECRGERENPSN